ncbi:MAG: hypothetical protein Q9190_003917 [Brigantiaea leucoxantha]
MVRKLKHHEQKLLKKVSLHTYRSDPTHRIASISRRYHLPSPATYHSYSRLCGNLRHLAHLLSLLSPDSAFRTRITTLLLQKLYSIGLLSQGTQLSEVERSITVSKFCRRRLGVLMTRLGMEATVSGASKLVEQGHVRVGVDVVTDPAFLVTRGMEDYVTWVDGSKVRRNILKYRGEADDFDLL